MAKKILTIILNVILAIIILFGLVIAFSMLPFKGNYKLYAVMSGSMSPKIRTGSIVVVKPITEYKVGDVVTYKTSGSTDKTTHRIVEIQTVNNEKVAITRGDANNAPDTKPVKASQIVGKEYFSIPCLGYVLQYIKTPVGLILIIIIPAVIIIYEEFRKIINETKKIIKNKREGSKKGKTRKDVKDS